MAGNTLALAAAPVGLGSLAARQKENFADFRLGLARAPYLNSTLRSEINLRSFPVGILNVMSQKNVQNQE
jgi:hypothetical protein